jgi:hypothetical protein
MPQVTPHPPQLLLSPAKLTQKALGPVPHRLGVVAGQEQTLLTHDCPVGRVPGQTVPHVPQLFKSVAVSTQLLLHAVCPTGQVTSQTAFEQ